MKKVLLSLSLLCLSLGIQAQVCTPNPVILLLGVPGIFPNQATGGMPDGDINVAYSQTFTVVVPADTTLATPLGTFTLAIDVMEVTAVDGLPAGLSYTCDGTGCSWPGNSNGCFKVSGTPTVGGDFTVDIQTTVTVTVPGLGPFTTPAFPISVPLHINDPNGISQLQHTGFLLGNVAPNPFSGNTSISFNAPKQGTYSFIVTDVNGRSIFHSNVNAIAGANVLEFNGAALSPGIYHFRFEQNGAFATGKMIITKN